MPHRIQNVPMTEYAAIQGPVHFCRRISPDFLGGYTMNELNLYLF